MTLHEVAAAVEARMGEEILTNNERAALAGAKIRAYSGPSDDPQSDVIDFLTDLRHYCDARGLDFVRLNNIAREHHEYEVAESGPAKKTWED